ncbi:MAG: hypothetical protein Q9165_006958 [Trypethelium subeluteriae]
MFWKYFKIKRSRGSDGPESAASPRKPGSPDMNWAFTQKALSMVDQFIKAHNVKEKKEGRDIVKIQIEGVGGIVRMYVRGEGFPTATKDINYCAPCLSNREISVLNSAIIDTKRMLENGGTGGVPLRLDKEWFSNVSTELWIPEHLPTYMAFSAGQQGEYIYRQPEYPEQGGLQVLACPWEYSVSTKLHRLAIMKDVPDDNRDVEDIAIFLHKFMEANALLHIGVHEGYVKEWMMLWQLYDILDKSQQDKIHEKILPQVSRVYMTLYGDRKCYIPIDEDGTSLSEWKSKIQSMVKNLAPVALKVGTAAAEIALAAA